MPALAAVTASVDKIRHIPTEFWVRMALAVAVIVVVVVVLRKLAKVNKVVLGVIVVLGFSFVGFSWIDERNEPAWATPAVSWLAGFFPTKGKVIGR